MNASRSDSVGGGGPATGGPDESNGAGVPNVGVPNSDDYETESRWIAWKEKRFARTASTDEEPAEPFESPKAFRRWSIDAARGLLDVQFHRPATRTLLPLAYILGLAFAIGIPIALTVLMWQVSAVLGVLTGVIAIPLGLTIAAVVRLLLEFLENASKLATRVAHISELADDLFQALADVAEPVNQLSEDVRAVQFWRFRKRGTRK
ncbi:DUF4282 domain-containing protein [Nocardia sp. NBC_00565]|uniref:DUF4282 domain-containing protein n=1 Tax=Nocardia sp. NBC_00565 TaxID=2975993 RepID=UPI002E82033C|nr:DUF4282 domain-containing protein [Nocardia sp. NBC_00565]WUC01821.1 DUF4282 domain-containing protein [Nocardia sp. NBC_00565]